MELTTDERIERALAARRDLIDITTTGRRTGTPRRIEIVFHNLGGRIYISGMPRRQKRDWLANLEADPRLTFHLKRTVTADLPARARIVVDEAERRAVLGEIIRTAWHDQDLEQMVRWSPLIEVTFEARAATAA
jgi:deazaflavin-dependent oxidoreductase (nitroreductase family)